jgi:hypothetical protein
LSEFDERTTKAELEELLGEDVTILEQVAYLERMDTRPRAIRETNSGNPSHRIAIDCITGDSVEAAV